MLTLAVTSTVLAIFACICCSVIYFGLKAINTLSARIEKLIEAQRLSTILKLEPSSLNVKPEDFEPKREQIKENLLEELEKQMVREDLDPFTKALLILKNSGWENFVDNQTLSNSRTALARLLANYDLVGARNLLKELADKL